MILSRKTRPISPRKLVAAAAAVSAIMVGFTGTASAGECPADKVMAGATKPGPMTPSMVTDTVIGDIKLDSYNIAGRELRLRKLVIEKGGVVPWHEHNTRPANIYVQSGTVTEYRSNCAVPIVHKAGDVIPEMGDIAHWWKNTGKTTAVLFSSDILPPADATGKKDDHVM
ncbi:MAG TPA: cupin domain-containing protein [Hyphomonadaceae bacterium]|nr:cupin domain-containing protein [Hyphomonadaceae bacterium]